VIAQPRPGGGAQEGCRKLRAKAYLMVTFS